MEVLERHRFRHRLGVVLRQCPFCIKSYEHQSALSDHAYFKHGQIIEAHKEENKMNDQMEQVWRSKDGKCVGSKEEVEAYLATLSPLGKMRFPYWDCSGEVRTSNESGNWTLGRNGIADTAALVAFANLAPLIEQWKASVKPRWMSQPELDLLNAYEEALKLVPR